MKNPEKKNTGSAKADPKKELPLQKPKGKFFTSVSEETPFRKKGYGASSVVVRQVKH